MDRDVVYLDYNATTPVAEEVQIKITETLKTGWGNPSSNSGFGRIAKAVIDEARTRVAACIGAEAYEIIFLSGGTEANNSVICSVVQDHVRWMRDEPEADSCKPHIITSSIEHDATLEPLQVFEKEGLIESTRLPIDRETGTINETQLLEAVRKNTVLVTLMLANNETGVIFDIPRITRLIADLNEKRVKDGLLRISVHTDAAQAIGKIEVDVKKLGVDYLTIVGHKFYGPRIGALYVRALDTEEGAPFKPMLFGGKQERGFRPGTENTPMIAGLGTAAALVTSMGVDKLRASFSRHRDYLESQLKATFGDDVVVNFESVPRLPNTCNVSFKRTLAKDLSGADILRKCPGVVASTGAACHSHITGGSKILRNCGVSPELVRTAIRFSTGRETSMKDVDKAVEELKGCFRGI
ncbi:unnamed protein product [Notodromas monacha]|uniref:Selenocysteine lyase n=1 Tax=Notodromas monacha TaxID=399045 RepID=A0A7R9BP52_9CRUS|nr:unnamed protein product [Notodromas monacha]CAG0917718.1 unnamed protein product [Notodromas monacha]